MIVLNCKQNTDEWIRARLGIPTSSNFDRIITPTGQKSSQAAAYRMRLHSEWLAGAYLDEEHAQTFPMMRGFTLQPQALAFYQLERDVDVQEVGFCYRDETRQIGCSPDGLVGGDGGLEIKCPYGPAHVEFLLSGEIPSKYIPQVQGSLWVTGREWWDFVSYHPSMPSAVIRVHRDEEYIATLEYYLGTFCGDLEVERVRLESRGFIGQLEGGNDGDSDRQATKEAERGGAADRGLQEGDPAAGEAGADGIVGGGAQEEVRRAILDYEDRTKGR